MIFEKNLLSAEFAFIMSDVGNYDVEPECGEIVIFHVAGYNNVGTVGDSISNKRGSGSAAHGHFSHHELRALC